MSTASNVLPFVPLAAASAAPAPAAGRFTVDGDAALEARLAGLCAQVREGVARVVPSHRLEGILLGGGYGRGEGGVLRAPGGDRPYNDLEFYVLLRGSTVINDRRHRAALDALGHALSGPAGLEVEFKITSLASLRRGAVTMFSYDLVQGHRVVAGPADLLAGCGHHERAEDIPAAEATRLLMNRCTGLLLARDRLGRRPLAADDADFVERNLAKAQLALGDAVLAVSGRYHWSCRERGRRLSALALPDSPPWLPSVRAAHAAGVEFKLHPVRSERTPEELARDHRGLSELAGRVWVWLESRRLGRSFRSPVHYALDPAAKCAGTSPARNWLVTARRLGWRELASRRALRYPRERLLRALPVLLWQPEMLVNPQVQRCVRRQLAAGATAEAGLLAAYLRVWEHFR